MFCMYAYAYVRFLFPSHSKSGLGWSGQGRFDEEGQEYEFEAG